MLEKRYQVFVSSTFTDLEKERQEVMHALLELDCLPAGMELFPAANESQWDLIKRVIDDSDYYVLIMGGRYGSLGPDGLSYTEMEYRYALDIGKPVLAFIHKDPADIPAGKSETAPEKQEKLQAFRELVQKKICKHWTTPADLGSVVSRSLIQLIKQAPGIGWVRGNLVPDKDATEELLRLRRKVEQLESELKRSATTAPPGSEKLAQGSETVPIKFDLKARKATGHHMSYEATKTLTWDQIFGVLAPLMIHEEQDFKLRAAINSLLQAHAEEDFKDDADLKNSTILNCNIIDNDFQMIKVQLRALGLIVKSEKNRSLKDRGTYWTLTPYGDDVMTRLLAVRSRGGGDKSIVFEDDI